MRGGSEPLASPQICERVGPQTCVPACYQCGSHAPAALSLDDLRTCRFMADRLACLPHCRGMTGKEHSAHLLADSML